MARRASERGEYDTGGSARKGRETEPDWARGLTPDQVEAERQARRLPLQTDPTTIDDDDVRARFEARLNRIQETGEDDSGDGAGDRTSGGGSRPSGRRRATASLPTPTLSVPRRLSVADGSGFALGLVLYALGINYLRYGPGGVKGWLAAKFLNRPMDGSGAAGLGGYTASTIPPGPNAQTAAALTGKGLIAPGAVGVADPTQIKGYAIHGSDGLWYPATSAVGNLKVSGAAGRPAS